MLAKFFETRNSFQSLFASGDDFNTGSLSGTVVNSDTAFQVNAIFGAVSLISDTVSTLPVDAFIRIDGNRRAFRPKPAWVTQPDIDTTPSAFWGSVVVSLLLDGNAFIRVFANERGEVVNLTVLNPLDVSIDRNALGRVMFKVKGIKEPLNSDEIVFIPEMVRPGHLRGISRVEALKEDFGLAIALRNYAAKFFGSGSQTSGIIEYPGNLTGDQAAALVAGFDSRHKGWAKSHKTGVLSGGAKYTPTTIENDKAQFLDSRRMAVEDIARAFHIPAIKLNLPGTNTFSSVEQQNLSFVVDCIRPLITKLEQAFSPLLSRYQGGETAFIKFNIDGLLRADISSRTAAYSNGLNSGWLTINDVRRLEDLSPIDDPSADTARVPLANVNVEAADLVATDKRVTMAQKLVNSGFDPAEVLSAMELPAIKHTGLASVQLQGVAQVNPENPTDVYKVD